MRRRCANCGRLVRKDWRPEEGKMLKSCPNCLPAPVTVAADRTASSG